MALRATPTIAICLVAALATGIALARPDDADSTADSRYESSGASGDGESSGESLDLSYGDTPAYGESTDDAAGDDSATDDGAGGTAAITIADFDFSGQTEVEPGTVIEVTNVDSAPHTLTSVDDLFGTDRLGQNAAATITAPDGVGTYEFFCEVHPSMRGELVVS
ncbi:MAG: cupredoxin domain-containing protein [Ilumatobacteraceae bacterium]